MFWNKKPAANSQAADACAKALFNFLYAGLKDEKGVRVEDIVCAAASIVGERCIEAAGDFNPRKHTFAPGSRVFSDKVNALLCGDNADVAFEAIPGGTVFGMLRDTLAKRGYPAAEFPPLKTIFQNFPAGIGRGEKWGAVPLSIPEVHFPRLLPLRVAYETRGKVDKILEPMGSDTTVRMSTTVLTLAETLAAVVGAIDHRLALMLALETVNGMAKTAPMTDEAMAKAQHQPPPIPGAKPGGQTRD